jgi:RNA polymerase sigma factor (sigma-70 family)
MIDLGRLGNEYVEPSRGGTMHDDSPATTLLENATRGVESAWREIVKRYSPLVFALCHRYGIRGADAQDVGSSVWLRLLTNSTSIRQPQALRGWLLTTARNECLLLLHHRNRQIPTDSTPIGELIEPQFDANLIAEERRHAARQAFAQLSRRDQQLLSMLFSDPPKTYQEISSTLGIPVGSIGPTRTRCLTRARRTPAIAALVAADHHSGKRSGDINPDRNLRARF